MSKVALGFLPEPLILSLDNILPGRRPPEGLAGSRKFRQIQSSIAEVGLIEPLSVLPLPGTEGRYTLLDGHIRLLALRELGIPVATCLQALDDESYTYNNRLNRLSTIQEHYMLRRAIGRGVSPERLAKALSIDVSHVIKKMNLLEGLCPEVTGLLEDRQFSPEISRVIRKMKPTRQIECVELMISADNMTVAYAEALLAATSPEMLNDGKKPPRLGGITREQMARMEREMDNLHGQYKIVEQSYGDDVLTLVLARGYLVKLLGNVAITKFLKGKTPEILEQFQAIAKAGSLED